MALGAGGPGQANKHIRGDAHLMCPLGIHLWGWRKISAVVVITQTGASCRVLGGMSYGRAMGAAGEFESGALINLL